MPFKVNNIRSTCQAQGLADFLKLPLSAFVARVNVRLLVKRVVIYFNASKYGFHFSLEINNSTDTFLYCGFGSLI